MITFAENKCGIFSFLHLSACRSLLLDDDKGSEIEKFICAIDRNTPEDGK